jgi:hypothetical protein
LCELSEGLAFKYFVICRLNQAHRQYVDSDALAFCQQLLPFDLMCIIRWLWLGVKGFEGMNRRGAEGGGFSVFFGVFGDLTTKTRRARREESLREIFREL